MCLLCDPICPVEVIGLAAGGGGGSGSLVGLGEDGDRRQEDCGTEADGSKTSSALCILPSEFLDFHRRKSYDLIVFAQE